MQIRNLLVTITNRLEHVWPNKQILIWLILAITEVRKLIKDI